MEVPASKCTEAINFDFVLTTTKDESLVAYFLRKFGTGMPNTYTLLEGISAF